MSIKINFNGVNHLAMATGDMDKTIRFWRDLLGMRLVAGLGQPGYRHYFFEISPNDLIAFFEWEGVEPMIKKEHGRPVSGRFGFDHVSFGVEEEEDLWNLKAKLEAAGFPVSEVIDHGFIHSIYAYDPNNIPIEFSHNVSGIDIRKEPRMGDIKPTNAALEGSEPLDKWPKVKRVTPPEDRIVYRGVGSELFQGYERG
ncbi:Glyoxalase/Bleomycin resistance protein/Dioxygenase superfamily protein [uncultured archaeon]|nr:Glyoxalase/Bleomycin resistance protein/Dioxygenase superfamily protein [uncultured archaeon]